MAIGTRSGNAARRGGVLLAGLIAVLAASPLAAQQTVGRQMGPSVSVDYGVLDALGPEPTLPALLLRGMPPAQPGAEPRFPVVNGPHATQPGGRVVLIPPGKKGKAKVRKRATRKRRATSVAPTARTAEKPAVRRTAKALKRPQPAPPQRSTRTQAPPLPTPPEAPPVPLTPAPMAPMAPMSAPPPVPDLPPPPAMAGLPPPPPSLPAPPASAPPPAPVSEPVAEAPPAPVSQPVAAPPPAAKPSPPPAPMETASLPPQAPMTPSDGTVQILFEAGSAKLDKTATDAMSRLANAMKSDASMRIQLLAYASGTGGSASQARRLSLSRALAARSYLIGQGVRSTRIDVRALGDKSSAGPPDRVDLTAVRR